MKRIYLTEEGLNTLLQRTNNSNIVMNVLIGCEESQTVCKAFRKLGHNAYSCDFHQCSGEHPEWHFNCDIFEVLNNKGGITQAGTEVKVDKWNLLIAHPPCTYLAVSGARWLYNKDENGNNVRNEERWKNLEEGAAFFMKLANADVDRVCIENPVGFMGKRWRKPDQLIQPWQFGDMAKKLTCLWLKNLPPLDVQFTEEPEGLEYTYASGKKLPKWYSDALRQAAEETSQWVVDNGIDISTKEGKAAKKMYYDEARRRIRSKTFLGIAKAMAKKWGSLGELEQ
jgi:hypothetical protein